MISAVSRTPLRATLIVPPSPSTAGAILSSAPAPAPASSAVASQSWGLNLGGFFQATFGWLAGLVGNFFSWLGGVFSGTAHV